MTIYRDGEMSLKANSGSCPAYRFTTVTGNNEAGIHLTATSLILGVSQEDASSTGQAWRIKKEGTTKITCGESISAGALVIPQTDTGKAMSGTKLLNTTTTVIPRSGGIALKAGSTNAVIEVALAINNIRIAIS